MTGSQNTNTHGEQNMELWRKFSWGKEQQLKHIPVKTSSPTLCWIFNNCPYFIPKWASENFTPSTSTITTTAATTTTITTKKNTSNNLAVWNTCYMESLPTWETFKRLDF